MALAKKIAFFAFLAVNLMADGLLAFTLNSPTPKRGLGANDHVNIEDFSGNGSEVVWQYNWASNTTNKQPAFEYVPMLWNIPTDPGAWNHHANAWIAAGSGHLLAFNEPENVQQSNIPVADAVQGYQQYMDPFAGKAKLGAPAVSNDGYEWMSQFLGNCTNCTIDFVPIHWYNPVNLLDDFKNFVSKMCDLAGNKPVWVTEFMPTGDNTTAIADFMSEAIAWLDDQQCVERYAYFGTADGSMSLLNNGGPGLSALGQSYAFTPYGGGGGVSAAASGGNSSDAKGADSTDECGDE